MNAGTSFLVQGRLAVSPYARRLALKGEVDLAKVAGTGPDGRIVAADVLAHQAALVSSPPERSTAPLHPVVLAFSAEVSLAGFYRLAADAAQVGLEIAVEDAAFRAARAAFAGLEGNLAHGIALEADLRQIMICRATGFSIGAERRLRLEALDGGADVSAEPAAASMLVLHSARAVPVALPLLSGRALRIVLVVDRDGARGHAMLCADADAMTAARAIALLEFFVGALEQPLGLLA